MLSGFAVCCEGRRGTEVKSRKLRAPRQSCLPLSVLLCEQNNTMAAVLLGVPRSCATLMLWRHGSYKGIIMQTYEYSPPSQSALLHYTFIKTSRADQASEVNNISIYKPPVVSIIRQNFPSPCDIPIPTSLDITSLSLSNKLIYAPHRLQAILPTPSSA